MHTYIKLNTVVLCESPFLYVRSYLERNGGALEGIFCLGNEHRCITLHPANAGIIAEYVDKLTVLKKEFTTLKVAMNVFLTDKHKLWREPFKERGDSGAIVHYRRRLFLQTEETLNLNLDSVGRGDFQLSRAIFTARVSTNTNMAGANFVQFCVTDCNRSMELNFTHRIKQPTTHLDQLIKYLDNYIATLNEVAQTAS